MENRDMNRDERILGSLDGLQKATVPDFFYTRLIGRLQDKTMVKRKPFFLLRPVFITPLLAIVLAANIFSLTQLDKKTEHKTAIKTQKASTIESFAEAYQLNTGSVYE
jgi:hypothetical protein